MSDWQSQIIEEFRTNKGKVSGFPDGAPLLLLTTTGIAEVLPEEDGEVVVNVHLNGK